MTKLALVADVHVSNHRRWGGPLINGLNARGIEIVDVLRRASILAAEAKAERFIVLGDLFDHTRPTPQLVRATADALKAGGLEVIVLLGNHDMQSDGGYDHACASLELVPGISIISRPMSLLVGDTQLLCCPYLPGLASEWLPESLGKLRERFAPSTRKVVLLTHLGIWNDETPAFLKATRDSVGIGQINWLCEAHGIHAVFAGNWHKQQCLGAPQTSRPKNKPIVVIPGTLCPNGFQEPDQGKVGWMIYYESGNDFWSQQHVEGPAWHTVDITATTTIAPHTQYMESPVQKYMRLRCAQVDMPAVLAARDLYEKLGAKVVIEVAEADAAASVKESARAAVAAASGDLTSGVWADLAEVQEPGTKAGVIKRLEDFRKAAL